MSALKDPKHELFCQEIQKGCTNAEAAERAGFKRDRKTAWALRRRKDIVRRLDELQRIAASREAAALARAAERYSVTTERVVGELARIAFANTMDYWTIDSNGEPRLDLRKINRDQGAAIQEVIVDTYMDGKTSEAREVKRVRIKLADKRAALVDLGRHLGLFVDPSVVNLNVSNYFTEKPPSMAEWRKEIELTANPTGDDRAPKEKRLRSVG